MQQIAMSWLVYRLTNSALLLGVVGFSNQIPVFLFASIAGVYADRCNRHRILIVTQTLAMIQALILAFLTLIGAIHVWHIIVLSIFLGMINAFDMPTRLQSIVEEDKRGRVMSIYATALIGMTPLGNLLRLRWHPGSALPIRSL